MRLARKELGLLAVQADEPAQLGPRLIRLSDDCEMTRLSHQNGTGPQPAVQQLADIPRGIARRVERERIALPRPVAIPDDLTDSSSDEDGMEADDADSSASLLSSSEGSDQDDLEPDLSYEYDAPQVSSSSDEDEDLGGEFE